MARNRMFGGLFETKAKANPKEAVLRAAGGALGNGGQPLGVAGPWDMAKATKDGLERVSVVFRCVDAIAQKQASIPMDIRKAEPGKSRADSKSVDDMDLWKLLNFRANSYESSMEFRYRLSATLLLSRRGAFVEMVRGENGKIAELHLLAPGQVEPIPDPKTFVSGYQIMRGDYVTDVVEPERVAWIKIKPHPMDPYSQLTPLMSAGIAVETDYLARVFNRNFLANDGRPGMLVTIQGNLNVEDAAEIKSRFNGGIATAGRTSVIEADGLDVADLAANPRDVQWESLLRGSKEDLQLAFGVPESMMGNASGRTFDNADAERENFYVDTIVPHCDPIAFGLDAITGDVNDDVVVAYDYSGIDVLQRMASRKREEWRTEVAVGLRTIDEYMTAIGEEPWDVVGTRVLFHTSGLAIAKNDDDQAGIMKLKPVGADAPPGDPGAAAQQGALEGAQQGAAEAQRQLGNANAANSVRQRAITMGNKSDSPRSKLQGGSGRPSGGVRGRNTGFKSGIEQKTDLEHPYLALRHKMEGMVEGHLTQWDARQENVVAERLSHAKFRKGTRHWDGEGITPEETKAINAAYAVHTDEWVTDLTTGMSKTLRTAMMREARNAATQMKSDGLPAPTLAEIKASVDSAHSDVMSIVGKAARNQSERLVKAIAKMDADGASMKQIETKVRQMTGQRAPWRKALAINTVTTAVEAARSAVYERNGRMYTKTWHAERDTRTRHTHVKADGQTRQAKNAFTVGGFKMQFPGDPTAPIQEVANCRCWVEYDPSDAYYRLDL